MPSWLQLDYIKKKKTDKEQSIFNVVYEGQNQKYSKMTKIAQDC